MGRWSADRLAATSGIGLVALFIASLFIPTASPPDASDPNEQWVSYLLNHHRAILVGAVLFGASMMLLIWFVGSVGAALRAAGEQRLAAVAFGGGIATAAVGLLVSSLQGAAAYGIATDAPSQVKGFVDLSFGLETMVSFPVAVLIGATAIASWRTRLFPRWWTGLSGVGAVVMVSGGATLAHSGFYRPDGPWAFVTLIVFLVWLLVTSVWLLVRAEAAPAAAAA